jgi:hypothetical protein
MKTEGEIKDGQSRKTGNIGPRHVLPTQKLLSSLCVSNFIVYLLGIGIFECGLYVRSCLFHTFCFIVLLCVSSSHIHGP